MPDAFLLSRVRLEFESENVDLLNQLSAVACTPDGHLWVGSDEFLTVERLTASAPCQYGQHQAFHLNNVLNLVDAESEIDIEGLDYSDGYLWLVGSHSAKRKKPKGKKSGANATKDIQRLAKVSQDANRYLLARIPVMDGQLVPSATPGDATLTAASFGSTPDKNSLLKLLKQDEHLGPFLKAEIPSKDNGFDIEGLAVHHNRVFLGLRGPVLVGWAMLLELELELGKSKALKAKKLGSDRPYRKHFLDLNGLGIRDLCFYQGDLILLAGPTMSLPGTLRLFRWREALKSEADTLWPQDADALEWLFDLPYNPGRDNAEGLAIFPCLGYDGLMVVYDAPDPVRCPDGRSIFADVFRLPH